MGNSDEKLKQDKKRQSTLSKKRKGLGLNLVKIYLDAGTRAQLDALSIQYGYKEEGDETAIENRVEVLSNIVGYCIKKAAGIKEPSYFKSAPSMAVAQQIYRLRRIIIDRKKRKGSHMTGILNLLRRYEQPNLDQILESPHNLGVTWRRYDYPRNNWSAKKAELLLDADDLHEYLSSLNARTTSKKKRAKQ
ncbi:MAG TPA: hypothetical protein DEG76_11530 [Pseudohongiella sp.]|nr:hypothetical protein [Pseudohongiella sp.]MEC8859902.1 hypothetical protein [Pseudomonadota bacterium]HBX37873.1 hypothetical protein [Pseudohongiella sp.]|tara:strand:- start:7446 stop:8018 length:573 start_codon:yes stop_codon:yes gene_type:complete